MGGRSVGDVVTIRALWGPSGSSPMPEKSKSSLDRDRVNPWWRRRAEKWGSPLPSQGGTPIVACWLRGRGRSVVGRPPPQTGGLPDSHLLVLWPGSVVGPSFGLHHPGDVSRAPSRLHWGGDMAREARGRAPGRCAGSADRANPSPTWWSAPIASWWYGGRRRGNLRSPAGKDRGGWRGRMRARPRRCPTGDRGWGGPR